MTLHLTSIDNIAVKISPIHGYGLYALRSFCVGEVVVTWKNTREITQDELDSLPPHERHYIDIQDGKILLVGEPERFVNHSCNANTTPGNLCDIANRDIPEGDEITADYGQFFIPGEKFQCKCGSTNCRGIIYGRGVK